MAPLFPRRPKGGGNSRLVLSSMLIGMILGALLVLMFVSRPMEMTPIQGESKSLQAALADSARSLSKPSAGNGDGSGTPDDGWHPIHVFYGERSGLGVRPKAKWFAQVHQDEIVVDILGKNGFFIDLAANDAMEFSNTLALELFHGWHGLCVEPNPTYWFGLSHRKCTVVGAMLGDAKQKVNVKFRGVYGGILGMMDIKMANRKLEPRAPTETRYTVPLLEVLERFQVPPVVDYLSLDVEGAEYLIMKKFPFDEYHIKLMTVERPKDELKQLLESKGFVYLKDLAWWGETLWAHQSLGLSPAHPKIAKIVTEERH